MPLFVVRLAGAENIDQRLAKDRSRHRPECDLDQEIARIAAVLKRLEVTNAGEDGALARNQDKQGPRQKSGGSTNPIEAAPRSRGVLPGQEIGGEVRSRPG